MLSTIRIADVFLLLLISQITQAGPVRHAERLSQSGWNSTASAVTSIDFTSTIALNPTHVVISANSVTAQREEDGPTPSPIFTTLDDKSRSPAVTTQPVDRESCSTTAPQSTAGSPSTTGTEPAFLPPPLSSIAVPTTTSVTGQGGSATSGAATLPPVFSSTSLPPFPTTGFRNESSLLPDNPVSSLVSVPGSLTETLGGSATTTAVPAGGERGTSPGHAMQSSLSFAFPIPGPSTTAASTPMAENPAAPFTTAPGLSSTAADVEASSSLASITYTLTAQPSSDTPASASSSTPPAFQTVSPSSATLKVTGAPIVGVPTIETSIPAATATVSPEVAASNLARAKSFNALFATLTEQSACSAGQIACLKGNIGKCGSDGAFGIENCNAGTSCFALPMNTTEGVIVGCYNPAVASNILGESVAVPAPGSSTSSPAQAPPPSGVVSEITTTVTPIITATSTIRITPPSSPETTTPAVPIATATSTVLVAPPQITSPPGFTTTIIITRTVEPDPSPSATSEKESTTTADEEPTTLTTSTRRRTRSSTSTAESSTPATTDATTITDTLTFAPIPSTVPSVLVGAKATDGPGVVTIKVTVTEKETVTVTTTAKNIETLILTITKTQ